MNTINTTPPFGFRILDDDEILVDGDLAMSLNYATKWFPVANKNYLNIPVKQTKLIAPEFRYIFATKQKLRFFTEPFQFLKYVPD